MKKYIYMLLFSLFFSVPTVFADHHESCGGDKCTCDSECTSNEKGECTCDDCECDSCDHSEKKESD